MREFGALIIGAGEAGASLAVPYHVLERAVPIHRTVSELVPTMLGEMRPAE